MRVGGVVPAQREAAVLWELAWEIDPMSGERSPTAYREPGQSQSFFNFTQTLVARVPHCFSGGQTSRIDRSRFGFPQS